MLVKLNTSAIHKISNDPMTHEARYYLNLAMGVRNAYKVPSWIPTSELLAGIVFNVNDASTSNGGMVVKFHKCTLSTGHPRSYLHKSSPLFKRYGIPWTDKKLSWHLYEEELDPVEEWDTYTEINQKLLTL